MSFSYSSTIQLNTIKQGLTPFETKPLLQDFQKKILQEIKVFNFSELNYLSLVNEQEIYEKFFSKYLNIDNKDLSCFFYKNKKAVYYLEEDTTSFEEEILRISGVIEKFILKNNTFYSHIEKYKTDLIDKNEKIQKQIKEDRNNLEETNRNIQKNKLKKSPIIYELEKKDKKIKTKNNEIETIKKKIKFFASLLRIKNRIVKKNSNPICFSSLEKTIKNRKKIISFFNAEYEEKIKTEKEYNSLLLKIIFREGLEENLELKKEKILNNTEYLNSVHNIIKNDVFNSKIEELEINSEFIRKNIILQINFTNKYNFILSKNKKILSEFKKRLDDFRIYRETRPNLSYINKRLSDIKKRSANNVLLLLLDNIKSIPIKNKYHTIKFENLYGVFKNFNFNFSYSEKFFFYTNADLKNINKKHKILCTLKDKQIVLCVLFLFDETSIYILDIQFEKFEETTFFFKTTFLTKFLIKNLQKVDQHKECSLFLHKKEFKVFAKELEEDLTNICFDLNQHLLENNGINTNNILSFLKMKKISDIIKSICLENTEQKEKEFLITSFNYLSSLSKINNTFILKLMQKIDINKFQIGPSNYIESLYSQK